MHALKDLHRGRSPFLDRGGLAALLGGDERPRIHADAASLRSIRDGLMEAASRSVPKAFSHMIDADLMEVEHLFAIYVLGYEFNVDNTRDDDGDPWEWRVGLGTYCSPHSALKPWMRDLGWAASNVRRLCPHLRIQTRIGGRPGVTAKFSRKHPVAALAGAPVVVPAEWPRSCVRYSAIPVNYALLEGLAMEAEHDHPRAPRLTRPHS